MKNDKFSFAVILSNDDIRFLRNKTESMIKDCAHSIFSLDFSKENTPAYFLVHLNDLIYKFTKFLNAMQEEIDCESNSAHKTIILLCKVHYYIQQCLLSYMKLRNNFSSRNESQKISKIKCVELSSEGLQKNTSGINEVFKELKLYFQFLTAKSHSNIGDMYNILNDFKSFLDNSGIEITKEPVYSYFSLLEGLYMVCRRLFNHQMKRETSFSELTKTEQKKTGAICKKRIVSLENQVLDENNNDIHVVNLRAEEDKFNQPDSLLVQSYAIDKFEVINLL